MGKMNSVLYQHLAVLVPSMGYELVGYELLSQGRTTIFRIYIDKEGGVTVEDCSRVSRQVGALIDVEGPDFGHYSLEVSSPGIDRPLFEVAHYQQYLGRRARNRLREPINQRRQFTGILLRVEDQTIYLGLQGEMGQEEVKLPFSLIEKGNLIGDVIFK